MSSPAARVAAATRASPRAGCTLARLTILVLALAPAPVRAQSALDLEARLHVDASSADFTPDEAVFRNADACSQLVSRDSCGPDEEPSTDSRWSALQDVHQLHVTWDARRLYVAADARLGGHALLLLLDFRPGGLRDLSGLLHWRRGVRFAGEFRPDAFLAVHDAERLPELWLVEGEQALQRLPPDDYEALSSFDAEFPGGALEAAIPWRVLFPGALHLPDPEPGAGGDSVFVLPPESSRSGLRIAAVVVHAEDGFSGPDVAPDNLGGMPLDARAPAVVDRAARVDWDADRAGPPFFIDFGIAVQRQASPRFVPPLGPGAPPAQTLRIAGIETFAVGPQGRRASRLLMPEAGYDLEFALRLQPEVLPRVVLSAAVFTLRGERVRDLYRDLAREPATQPPPFGPFGDPGLDRWDGRDAAGRRVPGGVYVLQVSAGASPGAPTTRERRVITVVR